MNHFKCILVLSMTLAGQACADPAADKPAAAVSEAKPASASATQEQAPAVGGLSFSESGSSIVMVGSKVTGSHSVEAKAFKGTVSLPKGAAIESGSVQVVIQMGSLQADHPKLTSHLMGGDFFLVSTHPTARFESTTITKGAGSFAVEGNLTLRGVTKSISFPATIARQGDGVSVKTEFSINRKDFGVNYPGKADDLIRDDVVVKLDLNAD